MIRGEGRASLCTDFICSWLQIKAAGCIPGLSASHKHRQQGLRGCLKQEGLREIFNGGDMTHKVSYRSLTKMAVHALYARTERGGEGT